MEYADALSAARDAWMTAQMTDPLTYNGVGLRGHIEVGSFRGDGLKPSGDVQQDEAYAYLLESDLAEIDGAPDYQDKIVDQNGKTWTVLYAVSRSAGIVELMISSDTRPIL